MREFRPVTFAPGDILQRTSAPVEDAYFPTNAVLSVFATCPAGEGEVGMVGPEGTTALPLLFESERSLHRIVVQLPGEGFCMEAAAFRRRLSRHPELRSVLLRYAQSWTTQLSQTALANARNTVRERLARWLLMCHDRLDTTDLWVTHEGLASALSVRRPGVTVATHELEGDGAIRAKRGRIHILNRAKLETAANGSYGLAEGEYSRLFGDGSFAAPRLLADNSVRTVQLRGAA
jgi:CRP-like cAMP-binding protein